MPKSQALWKSMSGLACPNCGMEISIFSKRAAARELAKSYESATFLGAILWIPRLLFRHDMGQPVVLPHVRTARPKRLSWICRLPIAGAANSSIESLAN